MERALDWDLSRSSVTYRIPRFHDVRPIDRGLPGLAWDFPCLSDFIESDLWFTISIVFAFMLRNSLL